jgi:hypothetical protein
MSVLISLIDPSFENSADASHGGQSLGLHVWGLGIGERVIKSEQSAAKAASSIIY